jgi:hypothetical protein
MSKWTKVLFSVAVFSQVMTVFVLLNCKFGNAYYITDTDWFLLGLCSVNTITYVICGIISHKNDVAIANF